MNRALFLLWLACFAWWTAPLNAGWYYAAAAAAGGSSFSDAFTRADSASLGANWTEGAGDASIASNTLSLQGEGYVENSMFYSGTACTTVNQYVKVTLTTLTPDAYPEVLFRVTAAGSPCYSVFLWATEDQITFVRKPTLGDNVYTTIQTVTSISISAGQAWGLTITGTGTAVVLRGWANPTGAAPTSASNWGGDTTPEFTCTDDPGTPVDTGSYVGIGGEQNLAGYIVLDDFSGGDIP